MVAVLLLAGGALTGIHLLHTNTSAPLPAQLSTSDAGQPGSVPPVEQIPPAARPTPAPAAPTTGAPAQRTATQAPAQRPATTAPDRTPDSDQAPDSDRTPGAGRWHDPDGFPRRDQYPFRPRDGFGAHGPGFGGFGNRPGQTQDRSTAPAAPTDADRARQQVAYAICDRYHIPREHCQIEPAGQ